MTSECLLSPSIASFWPKIEVFIDNGPKSGPHEKKFTVFPNSEMLQTFRVEKVDGGHEVICLVSIFPLSYGPYIVYKSVFLRCCDGLWSYNTKQEYSMFENLMRSPIL